MASKKTIVFRRGSGSAVQLLGNCELPPGARVRQYRERGRIIIEPLAGWPKSFLNALGAFPDEVARSRDEGDQRDPFDGPPVTS